MTLILEDGSAVAGANSYVGVADLRLYAKMRGLSVPEADEDIEILLIKAMDFIEAKRDKFQGNKTHQTQELQFPRKGLRIDGIEVGETDIPRELRYAQQALAIEAQANDLQPNRLPGQQGAVIRKKVEGAVEVAYENTGNVFQVPAFAKPEALLSVLYKRNGLSLIKS